MKRIYTLSISIIVALYFTMATSAASQEEVFTLNLIKISQNHDPDLFDDSPLGNRMPPRPILCTISNDGIEISEIESSDITSFEIYTLDGFCVTSSLDLETFISSLYCLDGEYEIRFITDSYIFRGYLHL